jgi:phosphopantothenoylcysteine decarboxylase/phosphopantothenate--cysteine ligase
MATLTAKVQCCGHLRRPFIVGFAAETNAVLANARKKLVEKNADVIIANDVSVAGLGFASEHNSVWFVTASGNEATGLITKRELARLIVDRIVRGIITEGA